MIFDELLNLVPLKLLLIIFYSFPSVALADIIGKEPTIGFGYGATYGGLGFNVGLKSDVAMHYMAFGCVGITGIYSSDSTINTVSGNSKKESNCGFSIGSLRELKSKCCFGINVGQTHYSRSGVSAMGKVNHIRFTYVRFFKSLGKGGLNIGMSPVISFGAGLKSGQTLLVNFGMQF